MPLGHHLVTHMFARTATISLLTLLTSVASAQTPAQLKQELKTREAAASAKKDADALYEVGKWAAEKALAADAKRLYQAAIKVKPDHAGANEGLGNELVDGKWLPLKEAEAMRKKALAAEFTAKGLVEVDGLWVEKEKVADAKRGVFHHDGDLVTKAEMVALQSGKVRHPETGELVDAKHLEKAKNKQFPMGDRWGDEKEADVYHSNIKRPWIFRSSRCTLISTLPLAKLAALGPMADQAYDKVAPLLGTETPSAERRPVVIIAATNSEYSEDYGKPLGDGTDVCGAFLVMEGRKVTVPFLGDVRAGICVYNKDWFAHYVRHASALAYANAIAESNNVALPLWLLHGIAGFTSRFHTESDASFLGKQHIQKGGVKNLKGFFTAFALSADLEPKDNDANVYQAGLLVAFAAGGSDPKVTEAMQGVTAAITGKAKGADKAIAKLQAALIEAEPKIVAYLQQLAAK